LPEHVEVGERAQGVCLCSVFVQASVSNFSITENALDDQKRVFDLAAHAGLLPFSGTASPTNTIASINANKASIVGALISD